MGGTSWAHRNALSLTLFGQGPDSYEQGLAAIKEARKITMKGPRSQAREWTINWWMRHLLWHDWLPNEVCIQYRGPGWKMVHQMMYANEAKTHHMFLQYKAWKSAALEALKRLKAEYYPNESKPLRLVRCARHSNFPECTMCARCRKEYIEVAKEIGADPEVLQRKYEQLLEHANSWQADRETAIQIRHVAEHFRSNIRYQCDDKCGSFWQKLPVNFSGRDTKEDATAKYPFSIHANVWCGEKGISRFALVPKNVKCGADFGLTNLFISLLDAKNNGHLPEHVDHFYRHTDGGSDNVALVVHLMHWLLVHLGVFQTVTWFRFEAGHSHTEIADRLFSMLKKHFCSDSNARVMGMQDVPELVERLQHEFKDVKEAFKFAYNFANWDFTTWAHDQKLIGEMKHIKDVRVWRYQYDEKNWMHGGVTVQRKEKIAFKGSATECEWSPIKTVWRELPDKNGELVMQQCNESVEFGHNFVLRPPDMTKELSRQAWTAENNDRGKQRDTPLDCITRLLKVREAELSPKAVAYWKSLMKLSGNAGGRNAQENAHTLHRDAQSFPDLPFTNETMDGERFEFHGTPQPFKEVLRQLAFRFKRPLVPTDPFNTPPFATFEDAYEASQDREQGRPNEHEGVTSMDSALHGGGRRDPRIENNVTDNNFTEAERRKARAAAEQESFQSVQDVRVENVQVKQLYLIELVVAEKGLRLGLGYVNSKVSGKDEWEVIWYKHASAKAWDSQNPTFAPCFQSRGRYQTDTFGIESFRLQVRIMPVAQDQSMPYIRIAKVHAIELLSRVFACRCL